MVTVIWMRLDEARRQGIFIDIAPSRNASDLTVEALLVPLPPGTVVHKVEQLRDIDGATSVEIKEREEGAHLLLTDIWCIVG